MTRKHELPGPGAALSSRRRPVGRALTLILAMALAGLLFGGPAVAGRYEYPREGRPDPFTPFIKPKVVTSRVNPDEIVEEAVPLTGMRRFEPGQLTLVAVLRTGERRLAMVQDVTGRGYVLREGMPIGRRGEVTRIEEDRVVVTERARTRSGRIIVRQVLMRMHREGEE